MVIESANVTTAAITNRAEQTEKAEITKENNLADEGIPVAGQTSEVGPAVITNISATALETSRAINAPEQMAAQNKPNDIIEAEDKGQNQVKSPTPTTAGQDSKETRLDKIV